MTQQKQLLKEPRTIMFRVRVAVTEKALLEQSAKEHGLTLSDWVRKKALGSKPIRRKPKPEQETFLQILAALGKAGSNLNQVSRQLNRKQERLEFEVPIEEISGLLTAFKQISQELRTVIYGGNKG